MIVSGSTCPVKSFLPRVFFNRFLPCGRSQNPKGRQFWLRSGFKIGWDLLEYEARIYSALRKRGALEFLILWSRGWGIPLLGGVQGWVTHDLLITNTQIHGKLFFIIKDFLFTGCILGTPKFPLPDISDAHSGLDQIPWQNYFLRVARVPVSDVIGYSWTFYKLNCQNILSKLVSECLVLFTGYTSSIPMMKISR